MDSVSSRLSAIAMAHLLFLIVLQSRLSVVEKYNRKGLTKRKRTLKGEASVLCPLPFGGGIEMHGAPRSERFLHLLSSVFLTVLHAALIAADEYRSIYNGNGASAKQFPQCFFLP